MTEPWIGVDLDGTLAVDENKHDGSIGPPIPMMVSRVLYWLSEGIKIKIVTARVGQPRSGVPRTPEEQKAKVSLIQDWTEKYLGKRLDITCEKDYAMIELWDDRAVQVVKNQGKRVGNVFRQES